jgi:O-antigen/teichoic acid export membrane protein
MKTIQRILKNASAMLAANIASRAFGFFYIMYTARYLGAEKFGILSFALAFTGIFAVFADVGLQTLIIREVARDKSLADKFLSNIIAIKVVLVTFTFGLTVLIVNIFGYPELTVKVLYLVTLSIVFNAFSGAFFSIFRAYEKMEYESAGQILRAALSLACALFAIFQKLDVTAFAFIYFIVSVLIFGYALSICAWKFIKPRIEIDWKFWKSTLKKALPFSLTLIISGIFFNVDIIMLSAMKGDEFAGWYKAVVNIIAVFNSIIIVFIFAMFPVTSRLFISAKNSLIRATERSSKYLFIVGLPIAAGTFLLADRMILLIYGPNFAPAAIAVKILSIYLPLRVLSHVMGWTLASIDWEPLRTLSAAIALGLNVCLNFIFIPVLGIAGAGIAAVISQVLMFILYYLFLTKHLYRLSLAKIALKPCISCLVLVLFISFLKNINLVILIILSAALYFSILWMFRVLDSDDKEIFKVLIESIYQLLSKKNSESV